MGWSREECLEVVRGSLGEGFDHLCDVRDLRVDKDPVLGWVVIVTPARLPSGEKRKMADARPIVFTRGEPSYRVTEISISLGFSLDVHELDTLIHNIYVDEDDKVVGVLPPWPNTYYVIGYINNIAFDLGVHINPDDEKLKELLLEAYLDWIKTDARRFKNKLAKQRPGA